MPPKKSVARKPSPATHMKNINARVKASAAAERDRPAKLRAACGKECPAGKFLVQAEEAVRIGNLKASLESLAMFAGEFRNKLPQPAYAARVRAIFRQLGRLPAEHAVPEEVQTPEEFLAVLAANQDSPQKTIQAGISMGFVGEHFGHKDGAGRRDGYTRLSLRASATLNCGVEQEGVTIRSPGDTTARHCVWSNYDFCEVPASTNGKAVTLEQKARVAVKVGEGVKILCDLADAAKPLGFTWEGRKQTLEYLIRQYMEARLSLPEPLARVSII